MSIGLGIIWMAGKRLGQRDKEGATVPLDASDPVGLHIHPMTSAVRLTSSYTALYVETHSSKEKTPPLELD